MIITPHSTHTPRPGSNGCYQCGDITNWAYQFMTPIEIYDMTIREVNLLARRRQEELTQRSFYSAETEAALERHYSDEGPEEKGD